jgi:hypothetical protein
MSFEAADLDDALGVEDLQAYERGVLDDWVEQFEWKHDFVGALKDWPVGAARAAGPEPEPAAAVPSYVQLFKDAGEAVAGAGGLAAAAGPTGVT